MIPPSDKQIEAGRMAHWATDPEMGLADYLRTIYLAMLKEAPVAQELVEPDRYDAGLLGDGGGGDVEWWQDYIRAELERAHEFYADQIAALQPTLPVPQGKVERVCDYCVAATPGTFNSDTCQCAALVRSLSRPYGDAGDAIDFAVGCCGPEEAIAFLDDWRADRAGEWPGYMRWLETQRDGAIDKNTTER